LLFVGDGIGPLIRGLLPFLFDRRSRDLPRLIISAAFQSLTMGDRCAGAKCGAFHPRLVVHIGRFLLVVLYVSDSFGCFIWSPSSNVLLHDLWSFKWRTAQREISTVTPLVLGETGALSNVDFDPLSSPRPYVPISFSDTVGRAHSRLILPIVRPHVLDVACARPGQGIRPSTPVDGCSARCGGF
jgi:hypothetical protein